MIPFHINTEQVSPAAVSFAPAEHRARIEMIEERHRHYLQRLTAELKAQGVTSLLPPQTMELDLETGILTYEVFDPDIRTLRQSGTLWPKRLPASWRRDGVPRRTRRRPLPHPWRLVDLVREYLRAEVKPR